MLFDYSASIEGAVRHTDKCPKTIYQRPPKRMAQTQKHSNSYININSNENQYIAHFSFFKANEHIKNIEERLKGRALNFSSSVRLLGYYI